MLAEDWHGENESAFRIEVHHLSEACDETAIYDNFHIAEIQEP